MPWNANLFGVQENLWVEEMYKRQTQNCMKRMPTATTQIALFNSRVGLQQIIQFKSRTGSLSNRKKHGRELSWGWKNKTHEEVNKDQRNTD